MFPINKTQPSSLCDFHIAAWEQLHANANSPRPSVHDKMSQMRFVASLFLRWTDGLLLTWANGKHTLTKTVSPVNTALDLKVVLFPTSNSRGLPNRYRVRSVTRGTNHNIPSPYTVRKNSRREPCLPWWVWSRQKRGMEPQVNTRFKTKDVQVRTDRGREVFIIGCMRAQK